MSEPNDEPDCVLGEVGAGGAGLGLFMGPVQSGSWALHPEAMGTPHLFCYKLI